MSESRIKPGDTVYRVQLVTFTSGPDLHVQTGTVTPCGEWVDIGYARFPAGSDWYPRRCDAELSIAPLIERHIDLCRRYIGYLRERAAT